MKNALWKIGLLTIVLFLFLAEREFVTLWAITPLRMWVIVAIIALVFLARLVSPYLERMGNVLFFTGALVVFSASRLAWLLKVPTLPISDFYYYFLTACDVAAGRGLPIDVVLYQNGFGYQLLLGHIFRFLGCSLSVGKGLNLILGLVTIPILYVLAARFGGKTVGRWAVLLFVFWPVQLMYTSVLATEHLGLPLALLGFWLGVRLLDGEGNPWVNAVLCGLFLTLGALVRPAILIFLGAIGLVLLFQNKPIKVRLALAAVLAGAFLLVNQTYQLGFKLFNDGLTPTPSFSMAASLLYGMNYEANGQWSIEDANLLSSWQKDEVLAQSLQTTWQRVKTHTARQFVSLINSKNFEFWGSPYYGLLWSTSKLDTILENNWLKLYPLDSSQYLYQLLIASGTIVAAIRLLFTRGSARIAALLVVLTAVTAMHLILVVSSRYSYSFTPVLFVLASIGFAATWKTDRVQNEVQIDTNSLEAFNRQRIQHWDRVAENVARWRPWNQAYHRRLTEIYQSLIPPGLRVLEVGCGQGDLLAALRPSLGVGVDFSGKMIAAAHEKYPQLRFILADAHQLDLAETFDVIILSDLVDDVWDVEAILKQVPKLCTPVTRLILNYYSRMWAPAFAAVEGMGWITPKLSQNWLVVEDVTNLLYLANFEVLRHQREILWPFPFRPLDIFFNRFLVKIWPFSAFALTNVTIARPSLHPIPPEKTPMVSVIVPARNEAGNIPHIFRRVPEMGSKTEIVFVEGHSTDNTYEAIQEALAEHTRPCKLIKQTGKGKGDAVRQGFAHASGDILMILDADLTVSAEDLPKFYEALISGRGELINGVRLVYPMDKEAMRFFNFLGNKFFSLAFSWLLGQPVKDTLCGTKVLWKEDYELIAANRSYFGDFDPFGDYDLLFGAAKLNRKIVDLPIRYRERTYGTTNIQRWKHGWLLLKMVWFAAIRLKFV